MSDVIDRLDAVIAEETCPHCQRQWHDRPLTRRVAQMYDQNRLDASFFSGADESPIVCEGSYLIGPRRPEPERSAISGSDWLSYADHLNVKFFTAAMELVATTVNWPKLIFSFDTAPWVTDEASTWFTPHKPEPCPTTDLDGAIDFGPQHWLRTQPVGHIPDELPQHVATHWQAMTTTTIPTPTSPGYDFTDYDTQPTQYPTHKEWK